MDLKDILKLEQETSDRNATFKNHDIKDMAEYEARAEKSAGLELRNYLKMALYILSAPDRYHRQLLENPDIAEMNLAQRYTFLKSAEKKGRLLQTVLNQ